MKRPLRTKEDLDSFLFLSIFNTSLVLRDNFICLSKEASSLEVVFFLRLYFLLLFEEANLVSGFNLITRLTAARFTSIA